MYCIVACDVVEVIFLGINTVDYKHSQNHKNSENFNTCNLMTMYLV